MGSCVTTPFEIFICYRRSHATVAVTLFHRLREHFGDTVFIDHECLQAIESWRGQIDAVISGSAVMIAVLSNDWLAEIGRRFRDDVQDEVIRELDGALDADTPVLPLYVDHARSPTPADLHEFRAGSPVFRALAALSDAQALRWRVGADADLEALTDALSRRLRHFGERLVGRCQARLAQQLAGNGSVPWPAKFKRFGPALRRPALMAQIEAKLQSDTGVLVLHAEEGMGKTFVLGELLQRQSERATVLVDASDPRWRRGFIDGLRELLLEATPALVSKAELPLALAQPLWIAVDGLNEPGAVDDIKWVTLLGEALRLQSEGSRWRLIVTVRTGAWEKMKWDAPTLKASSGVQEFELPALTLEEAATVAKSLRFPWEQCSQAVRQQLCKPRLLVSVSRLKPEALEGWELTEGLVMLLDLQQQDALSQQQLEFEDYCEVLRELGAQWLAKAAPRRAELRELFSALDDSGFESALAELRDRGLIDRQRHRLAVHSNSAELAVALHLVEQLRGSPSGHQALVERVEVILADAQGDSAARVLVHALGAVLSDRLTGEQPSEEPRARRADPVLAALFLAWEGRFNRSAIRSIPWQRWLLPELIQLTEDGDLQEASDWLARALEKGTPPATDYTALLEAFDTRWFTTIDLSESWPNTDEDVRERRGYFEQARQRRPSFRDQPQSQLRRTALDVAVRCRLSPVGRDLHALCLSICMQPMEGWDRTLHWVQASRVDWWPQVQTVWRQIVDAGYSAPLHRALARFLYRLWPVEECWQLLASALEADDKPSLRAATRYGFETPNKEMLGRACRSVEAHGLDAQTADLATVVLWAPDRMDAVLARAADHAADPDRKLGFLGSRLAPFMPLLTPAQRRSIRRRLAQTSSEDWGQLDALSPTSCFGLSEGRRVAATLRQFRANELARHTLKQIRLSPSAVERLCDRLLRARESPLSGRLAFWLSAGLSDENDAAVRASLTRIIPSLKGRSLPSTTEQHLLRLASVFGLPRLAATLIPEGWSYAAESQAESELAALRNWTLANSGLLSADVIAQRCKPGTERYFPDMRPEERARQRISRTRETLLLGAAEWLRPRDVREVLQDDPTLIQAVIDAGDSDRATTVAYALSPADSVLWFPLARLAIQPGFIVGMHGDGIPVRYHAIFKTPDIPQARELWNSALKNLRNDEELLQFVIAALKGQGRDWLQEIAQISDTDLPHDQIAAAHIAAFAGVRAELPRILALRARSGGWIAQGLDRAIERFQSDQDARAWLERFHRAQHWSEACGSWLFHLEAVDLRHQLWEGTIDGHCQLPGADIYLEAQAENRKHAAKRRADSYRKTRLGLEIA